MEGEITIFENIACYLRNIHNVDDGNIVLHDDNVSETESFICELGLLFHRLLHKNQTYILSVLLRI